MTEAVEALKIALEQKADGIMVTFRIQPEDLPENLLIARINSRFALALVQIDDNEKPVPPRPKAEKEKKKQNANVMRAAIACGELQFQRFLQSRYGPQWNASFGAHRDRAATVLRTIIGADSRKALATEPEALEQFDRVMAEYEMYKRGE